MITSFGDETSEDLFFGRNSKDARKFPCELHKVARRKLAMLDAATDLRDLKSPPNNKLEALKSDLAGFHSIRVNDQYRIVFRWTGSHAEDVRVLDYH